MRACSTLDLSALADAGTSVQWLHRCNHITIIIIAIIITIIIIIIVVIIIDIVIRVTITICREQCTTKVGQKCHNFQSQTCRVVPRTVSLIICFFFTRTVSFIFVFHPQPHCLHFQVPRNECQEVPTKTCIAVGNEVLFLHIWTFEYHTLEIYESQDNEQ